MAGREGLRMAEADRTAAPSQVTGTGKGGLVVHLQLRCPQPDPTAQANRATTRSKPQGEVCLKPGAVSGSSSRRPRKYLVNTAQIAFPNKIHSRQLANPQEIRPAAEKFNEFLEKSSTRISTTPARTSVVSADILPVA